MADEPLKPDGRPPEDSAAAAEASKGASSGSRQQTGGSSSRRAAYVAPSNQQTVISKQPAAAMGHSDVDASVELDKSLEGQQLGHFKLEEFIGGGGMGAVYRAHDTMLGRVVAVKVLSGRQSADEDMVRRFKNEAQSAARLNHENIARVYFVGEDNGWHYIVFEYINGINIRDLVQQQGPLTLAAAISYLIQVAEALDHASRRDVVHRDIKPSNVLVTPEGRAKLVDMGLARLHQVESSEDDLTASGVTLGTFDYISPEQARDPRNADVRSDLYSLGCTFYFMLTGHPPFPDGTVLQKLLSHTTDDPPDPRDERPDVPEEVAAILRKMLAKGPDDRYQQPDELIGEFLMVGDLLGLDVGTPGAAVWITPNNSPYSFVERHLPWVASVLLLVVAFVGSQLFSYLSGETSGVIPKYRLPPAVIATENNSNGTSDRPNGAEVPTPPDDSGNSGHTQSPDDTDSVTNGGNGNGNGNGNGGASATANDDSRQRAPAITQIDAPSALAAFLDDSSGGFGVGPEIGSGVVGVSAVSEMSVALSAAAPGEEVFGRVSAAEAAGPMAPEADDVPTRVLIVGDQRLLPDAEPGQAIVDSLAAAASELGSALKDVEVIELRYDGPRVERPLVLELLGRKLIVRAGEEFSPIVRFEPEVGDPTDSPRSMITLAGGELVFEDVQLELNVPRDPPVDRWSLFQLQQGDTLFLSRCAMTVRNAGQGRSTYHEGVAAFIDVLVPSTDPGAAAAGGDAPTLVPITLEDCVARGEATFLRIPQAVPVRLKFNGGLLATTERLLTIGGCPEETIQDAYIKLDLDHLTAVVDGGLCLIKNGENAPYLATLDVECNDCIVVMKNKTAALFDHRGVATAREFMRGLLLSGRRNFYQNVDLFWRVDASRTDDQIIEFSWQDWKEHWADSESRSQPNGVQWHLLPPPAIPVHQHTPDDYLLLEHPSNPAYDSRAGFDRANLPILPMSVGSTTVVVPDDNSAAPGVAP